MPRRTKSAKIDTRSARTQLAQRREPYWARIARGCALGYRKGKSGGTWIARWQSPDGRKNYQAIGKADDAIEADSVGVLSFDQAQDRARDWFQQVGRGEAGIDNGLTVQECIEDYLDYLRRERSALTAYDSEKRAARYILREYTHRLLWTSSKPYFVGASKLRFPKLQVVPPRRSGRLRSCTCKKGRERRTYRQNLVRLPSSAAWLRTV